MLKFRKATKSTKKPLTTQMQQGGMILGAILIAVAGSYFGMQTFAQPEQAAASTPSIQCNTPSGKCNVLLIETDDQAYDTMMNPDTKQPRSSYLPKMHQRVTTEPGWYTFTQARAQDPLCGPSRWGQLTGQTSVHHNVTCHTPSVACKQTGTRTYRADRDKTYLKSLKDAGYFNSWTGKFLNWYPCSWEAKNKVYKTLPAGLDDAHIAFANNMLFNGAFNLVETTTGANATKVNYPKVAGDSDYGTYVIRDKTISAIDRCAAGSAPCFFAYMPTAPHQPGTPPEDYNPSQVTPVPKHYPSYNEGCPGAVDPDISDKPSFAQAYIKCYSMTGNQWTRNRMQEGLQAVDNSVDQIIQRLKDTGLYDNTVIIFTSDHGFSMNENNRITKEVPYDTASRVPFFMHVPGTAGGTINSLTYLPDITATLYDIAGATPIHTPDGKSLLPLVNGTAATIHPDGVFGSHLWVQPDAALLDLRPWYALYEDCSVVDECKVLIKYDNGEYELYNLKTDPYQLKNLLPNPMTGYPGVEGWDDSNPEVQDLKARLELRIVAGV